MSFLEYIVARLQEPSTWRGLVLIATAVGAHLTESQVSTIIEVGLLLAGFLGAALPDKKAE
jgi:hypothetical protein